MRHCLGQAWFHQHEAWTRALTEWEVRDLAREVGGRSKITCALKCVCPWSTILLPLLALTGALVLITHFTVIICGSRPSSTSPLSTMGEPFKS
jgi:hypothetical protein